MKKPYHIFFNTTRLNPITAMLFVIILTGFIHLSLFAGAVEKPGHPGNAKGLSGSNTLDKIGLSGSTPAAAAYSLRQLSSTYTGPDLRVRAGTTNAEADVAFDKNGILSAASVVTVTLGGTSGFSIGQTMPFSTFYGLQDVFVTTWYDQSGNALNFTQTYLSEQPVIVQAGVIVTLNNKPNILFVTSYLVVPGATIFTAGASMVGVAKGTSTRPSSFITKCNTYLPAPFDFTDVNGYFFEGDGTNFVQLLNPVLSNTTPRSDVSITVPESVYSFTIANQGNFFYYWNGASISSNTSTSFADIGSDMMMGNRQDGWGSGNFYSPEIVLFNSVLSDADRHTVEASQTAYYQVPPPTPLIFLSGTAAINGNITVFPGTPSASPDNGQISVSGSWLSGNITATASAGFQVSLSAGSGYAGSVALKPTAGTLANSIVYVRTTTAAPVSNLTGNVVLTSANATTQTVGVTVTAYPLPTVNTVASQTLVSGTATMPVNFTGTGPTFNWATTIAIGLPATGSGNIGAFTAVNNSTKPITTTITVTPVYPKVKYVISGPGYGVVQVTNGLSGSVLDTLKYVRSSSRGGNNLSPYYASSIAVSADESRLYIAQGLGIVAILNTSTNQAIGNIQEYGFNPVAISVSPDGNTAYVLDHTLGIEVSVMNIIEGTIVTNIAVPDKSTALSTSSDGAFVYVANSSNITVISTATNAVVGTVPLGSVALIPNKTTTGVSLSGTPVKFTITLNPLVNASAVKFTNTTYNGTTASWTNGNGMATVVFVEQGANGAAFPVNGTVYNPNTTFAAGDQVGTTGWYCVYNGTGSSVNITSLTAGTAYRVAAIAYNTINGVQNYLTTGQGPATVTTVAITPTTAAMKVAFTNTTFTGTTASWTNGNGSARAVFILKGANGSPLPANGTVFTANASSYSAGTQVGTSGWYCVYNGTGSGVALSGLTAGTTYRVSVVEYNTISGVQDYLTTGQSPANVTTLVTVPTGPATKVIFSNTTNTSTTASWTNGNGSARAVFMISEQAGTPLPVNGTAYSASSTIGLGTEVGLSNWYCVYNGTGSSVNISGLSSGDIYRVSVVEYNPISGTEYYLTTNQSPANVTTTGPHTPLNHIFSGGEPFPLISSLTDQKVEPNNILTPNGDGVNDTWTVKNITNYPNNKVTVYDRTGNVVYTKQGYANDWAGTYRGSVLNQGTYYYLVDLGNGSTLRGFITVVRDR